MKMFVFKKNWWALQRGDLDGAITSKWSTLGTVYGSGWVLVHFDWDGYLFWIFSNVIRGSGQKFNLDIFLIYHLF